MMVIMIAVAVLITGYNWAYGHVWQQIDIDFIVLLLLHSINPNQKDNFSFQYFSRRLSVSAHGVRGFSYYKTLIDGCTKEK
jgi:hypothetical protein